MSKTQKTTLVNNGGISFTSLLALIFITLKLTGYITWSWWWVLAPLWIPIALVLGIVLVFCVFAVVLGFLILIGFAIYVLITNLIKRRKGNKC